MVIDISVPATGGEYMDSVVVLEWRVQAGDTIEEGQILAIVETAKATIEIEAPESGQIVELKAASGEEVSVGSVLARLDTVSGGEDNAAVQPPSGGREPASSIDGPDDATTGSMDVSTGASATGSARASAATSRVKASPAARRYAREHGLALDAIQASSPSGRIKLRDLHAKAAPPSSSRIPNSAAPKDGHEPHVRFPTSGRSNGLVPLYLERRGNASERADRALPLIFIHGFAADRQGWVPLLAKLSLASPIVLIDLPGHGRSPGAEIMSVDDLAHHVAATLHENKITAGHIVGHSLGAAVGIALARDPKFKAASLCLLAPAGLGPDVNGDVLAGITRAQSVDSLYPWLRQLTFNGQQIDRGFAEFAMQQRQDPELRHHQCQMVAALFPTAPRRTICEICCVPLTYRRGSSGAAKDAIIPWRHALHVDGHAGLHLLPAVGHLPHIERPLEVARIIEELVRSAIAVS